VSNLDNSLPLPNAAHAQIRDLMDIGKFVAVRDLIVKLDVDLHRYSHLKPYRLAHCQPDTEYEYEQAGIMDYPSCANTSPYNIAIGLFIDVTSDTSRNEQSGLRCTKPPFV
jgi:hypothetical protein